MSALQNVSYIGTPVQGVAKLELVRKPSLLSSDIAALKMGDTLSVLFEKGGRITFNIQEPLTQVINGESDRWFAASIRDVSVMPVETNRAWLRYGIIVMASRTVILRIRGNLARGDTLRWYIQLMPVGAQSTEFEMTETVGAVANAQVEIR